MLISMVDLVNVIHVDMNIQTLQSVINGVAFFGSVFAYPQKMYGIKMSLSPFLVGRPNSSEKRISLGDLLSVLMMLILAN